jgi:Recombinase zinc beta ribbon domain
MSSGVKPIVGGFAIFFRIGLCWGICLWPSAKESDPMPIGIGARGTIKVVVGDWAVCLQTAHPDYIGWEEFMANQGRMADNVNRYEAGHSGALRRGSALLQGIAICGRCGRRMCLRYTGPNGDYPVYCCRVDRDQRASALCQEVWLQCGAVRHHAVSALKSASLDCLPPSSWATMRHFGWQNAG